jgi:ParB family chromosome partitioning protein
MAKEKGLGKGLSALFGSEVKDKSLTDLQQGEIIEQIKIDLLVPGKYQPRSSVNEDAINELADSIAEQGLMQPIIARKNEDNYEIIAGERRWRAAQKAKLEDIPVIVRDITDRSALAMALIENIQREDLSALEEANGIRRMIDEFEMTHEQAADTLGKSRVAISNLLRLLNLTPFVRKALAEQKIEMGHARALLPLNPDKQIMMCEKIVKEALSVRDVEALVSQADKSAFTKPVRRDVTQESNVDIITIENEISDYLGFGVKIKNKKNNSGDIKIHYRNLDELDVLIGKFKK